MSLKLDKARELDASDALKNKRSEFGLDNDQIYMDGNSLGPMPFAAQKAIEQAINIEWGKDLISSWNKHNWIDLPQSTAAKIAPIIGAKPHEVICSDSISINLFKLLSAALSITKDRTEILSERGNFPTDLYMVEGLSTLVGQERVQLRTVKKSNIIDSINDKTAVVLLTHVDFRTGEMLNMEEITRKAHQHDALVIWDLAHSAGALPLSLDSLEVDFAVGCGYKYLNGGPGSPAFLFVAEKHLKTVRQPLSGWMGHKAPFDFSPKYQAADNIEKFLCGTPPILSLSALNGALNVFEEVDMADIQKKSISLRKLFLDCLADEPTICEALHLLTPTPIEEHGSQLSFAFEQAFELSQALIDQGVIVDYRAPNVVRFGFTPLYLSHQEIVKAAGILTELIVNKAYLNPKYQTRNKVT